MRFYSLVFLAVVGCSSDREPLPAPPAPTTPGPMPTATGAAPTHNIMLECEDDPATPLGCVRDAPEADIIRDIPGVNAWLASSSICQTGAEIWLCKTTTQIPWNCIWIEGPRPAGFNPLCCAIDGVKPPSMCEHTNPPNPAPDCPQPNGDCYKPWCGPSALCMFTHYWDNGQPCDGGVCSSKELDGPLLCGPEPEQ